MHFSTYRPEITNDNFRTVFGIRNDVGETYKHIKFGWDQFSGGAATQWWNVTVLFPKFSRFFGFLISPTSRNCRPNLMRIVGIWHRTQLSHSKCIICETQDGCRCHLGFRNLVASPLLLEQSSPSLMVIMRIWQRTHLLHWKCGVSEIQNGARRHLGIRNSVAISSLLDRSSPTLVVNSKDMTQNATVTLKMRILRSSRWRTPPTWISKISQLTSFYYWTNPWQIWWEQWKSDTERNCNMKSAYSSNLKMTDAAILNFENRLQCLYYWIIQR